MPAEYCRNYYIMPIAAANWKFLASQASMSVEQSGCLSQWLLPWLHPVEHTVTHKNGMHDNYYVVKMGMQLPCECVECVDVCRFADVSLIGQRLGAGTLQGTQLFNQGATTTTFCLGTGGGRDNQVCENDTHGSITLINSSAIRLVEPYVTRITITDDECEWMTVW